MKTSYRSIPEMLLDRVAETPERTAFLQPSGAGWKSLSWKETLAQVRAVACGLRSLGLQPEDRCAILSSTRVEWIFADLGILAAGGATTTIYPSSTPEECRFIIADSGTRFVFAENDEQLQKLQKVREKLPAVVKVILFDGKASAAGADDWVVTFAELLDLGRAHDAKAPEEFEQVARAVEPTALATLVYTSGTTGQPKGVELTQDCWVYEGEGIDALKILTPDDLQYFWLPLSHVFGKVLEAAQIRIGFPTAVDGRVEKLVENLGAVRPTFVCAVPRIFEKVHNKVVANGTAAGGLKTAIFKWAFKIGKRVAAMERSGQGIPPHLALQRQLADRLVFAKVRALFGGRVRFFISGSAPLSQEMAEFFHSAGLLILEGYGLTESSAASFVNLPTAVRFGSVGKALPGTQVRIAPEDGEILLKGRGIMRGYHGLPDATRESLVDGWLRTGDIGELDADGFLKITDRKKDLIKTSGGKYVAPQFLEGKIKALSPWVDQVVVHGNNRAFVSALVTLDEEALRRWAKENGVGDASLPALSGDERVRALIKPAVDLLNSELPSYSAIKKFAILPAALTIEAGELTPSLKVKRKVVELKYKATLDGFYGSGG
jgi:long-chain acyl-CoA synthetase